MKPIRIQRKRTKGWKMPENTVCCNRPTKWGNPLKLVGNMIYIEAAYRRTILDKWVFLSNGDIKKMLNIYRSLFSGSDNFQNEPDIEYWVDEFSKLDLSTLRGKNLACFCSQDHPCHADVLLELANK